MIVKLIIAAAFLAILVSLGSALYHMMRHKDNSERMLKALSLRIGLSVLLIIFLFIAIALGLLRPHGIGGATQQQTQSTKK